MPGEVEFVDSAGEPDPSDQPLTRGRARPPRWMWLAGAGLASVVIAGSVLSVVAGGAAPKHPSRPSASTSPAASPSASASVSPSTPDRTAALPPAETVDPQQVVAAAFLGRPTGLVAVLRPGSVQLLSATRLDVVRSARLPAQVGSPDLGPWTLLLSGNTLWAVGAGINIAYGIDTTTLRQEGSVGVGVGVGGAALLDGHVYVTSADGLTDIAAASGDVTVRAAPAAGQALLADPARHRLLSVMYDYNNHYDFGAGQALVQAFRPGQPAAEWHTAVLPRPAGVLAVAAGAIWAGTADSGESSPLYRLDPATLRATRADPGSADARLVGAGTDVVWVRPGVTGDALWCLDARTGRVMQRWDDVPGEVISRSGAAVAIDGSRLTPLTLHGCRG